MVFFWENNAIIIREYHALVIVFILYLEIVSTPLSDLMDENIFAKRLKFAREKNGISQKKLGILIGQSLNNASPLINRYERGTRQPHPQTVAKISHALNIAPSFFYEPDEILSEIIFLLSNVTPQKKKLEIAEMLKNNKEVA